MTDTSMKRCPKCGIAKAFDAFHKDKARQDGLTYECKVCRKVCRDKPPSAPLDNIKQCARCHNEFPRTREHFSFARDTRDRLGSYCRICSAILQRESTARHREAVNARARNRRRVNSDACKERERQARRRDAEKLRKRANEYYYENKQKHIAYVKNRKLRKKSIEGTYTNQDILDLLKRQRYCCYYCKNKFEKVKGQYVYHIDHTIPISRAELHPRNDISHLVLACPPCNLNKRNKAPWEWPQGGRLL